MSMKIAPKTEVESKVKESAVLQTLSHIHYLGFELVAAHEIAKQIEASSFASLMKDDQNDW